MQHSSASLDVPRPRARPRQDDVIEALELQVAHLADLVLRLSSLAQRYEDTMGCIPPSRSGFEEQQQRVDTLRAAVERGRRELTSIGRG